MRKGKVLAAVLVLLLVAAGVAAYVERCTVISWYQIVASRMQSLKGGKSQSGAKALYYCPMHPAFTSDRPGSCAICGMNLVKKTAAETPATSSTSGSGSRKLLYYRNPMNPQVTSPVPMKDQMGMDYVPVYEETPTETKPAGVYINAQKQQLIGVKKEKIQKRNLSGQILTVGRVAYDPELFTTQQEYLQALKSRQAIDKGGTNYMEGQSVALIKTAKQKLLFAGMSEAEIDELEKQGQPQQNLYLPGSEDKNVWVYITIYEYEAGLVKEGASVEVQSLAYPGEIFKGSVVSITPKLESATRTLKARALVDNPDNKLKLEMFANVTIKYELGEKLAVPEDAVMHAGMRNIVFQVDANGYFTPRTVTLGAKAQGYYEVLQGLAAEEEVVTSGNFLVDSESKLNAVLSQMGEPNQTGGGHQHD